MCLSEAIRHEFLRIVSHAQRTGFMQTGPGHVRLGRRSEVFRSARPQQLLTGVLAVFPHEQRVRVPFEMKPRGRNAVYVLHLRIDIDEVFVAALCRGLYVKTDRRRIAALDFALVFTAESFDLIEVPRKLAAASIRVNRIASDELLLTRVVQILPAWHPGDCARRDVVRKARLSQQLRKVSARGSAV